MKLWTMICLFAWPAAAGLSCAGADTGEVGVRIVRADAQPADPAMLRDDGVDRDHVVQVSCQVILIDGTVITEARADVDPQASAGTQELRLESVPAASGYYARLRGYDVDGRVYECGASGPFEVARGGKTFVTIVIDQPEAGDPQCEQLCLRHADCPADRYCPTACVYDDLPTGCTENLCRPDSLGAACAVRDDCGAGYACVAVGYPNGYCSAACEQDYTCPGRGVCKPGQVTGSCVRTCETDSDCREAEGYVCRQLSTGAMACQPAE